MQSAVTTLDPKPIAAEGSPAPARHLGLFDVFCICAGAMISSGLFVLPGIVFAQAGPAIILGYVFAAILVIPALYAKAELATAMPKSGGSYFFIERSLGPLFGTVAGLLTWLSLSLKAAFALVGIGALALLMAPQLGPEGVKLVAVGGCIFFALVNAVSVSHTGKLQSVFVVGLLGIILWYILRGLPEVEAARFEPFMPEGWVSVFAVTGMVFVSFGGITKVAAVAEEVRDPSRTLPMGMFLAFGIVGALYIAVVFVTVGVVAPGALSGSLVPITLGAEGHSPGWGTILIGVASFFAFASTANAGILAAARFPLAMSKDGLLPITFAATSRRFGTPTTSIAVTAGFMAVVIALLPVEDLVKTASAMKILLFALVLVAVLVMRGSGIESYRPRIMSPLFPWLQIVAVALYAFLLFEMGTLSLLLTGAFALLAALWYLGYVQRRIDRESAVIHLVGQVTSRHMERSHLEDELRQIALERDNVELDRFDLLVADAPVLDIAEPVNARTLFYRVAETLAPSTHLETKELYEYMLERERESSTVIHPGLAIPHVIVPGEGIFELMLVRCQGGAEFSDLHEPVHTAFVLVGSADQRNFHLRALMRIAHIVQEPGFQERWLNATNPGQLKDVLLLARRTSDDD